MKCKYCGCTDGKACVGGCCWVLPNVCSSCVLSSKEVMKVLKSFFGDPEVIDIELNLISKNGEEQKFKIIENYKKQMEEEHEK